MYPVPLGWIALRCACLVHLMLLDAPATIKQSTYLWYVGHRTVSRWACTHEGLVWGTVGRLKWWNWGRKKFVMRI